NRIHKEHIIKHPGQFGDLPPASLALFLRADPTLEVARIGVRQDGIPFLHAIEAWVDLERTPLAQEQQQRQEGTQPQQLARLRTHLEKQWPLLRAAFPHETKAGILRHWDRAVQHPSDMRVEPWVPLLESFYKILLLVVHRGDRDDGTDAFSWSLGTQMQTVSKTGATKSPVVVLYTHYGGRLDRMRDRKTPAVELVCARPVNDPDRGYRFQFSPSFLERSCHVNPLLFADGRPERAFVAKLLPAPDKRPTAHLDVNGAVHALSYKIGATTITIYPATLFRDPHLASTTSTMSTMSTMLDMKDRNAMDVWQSLFSTCRLREIDRLPDSRAVCTFAHSPHFIFRILVKNLRDTWNERDTVVREWPSYESIPNSAVQALLRSSASTTTTDPWRNVHATRRAAQLLMDFFHVALRQRWDDPPAVPPALTLLSHKVQQFMNEAIARDVLPPSSAALAEWIREPTFRQMAARADDLGWRVDGRWVLPTAAFASRLSFGLTTYLLYEWKTFLRLSPDDVLPHFYQSAHDFAATPSFQPLALAEILHADEMTWRVHRPLISDDPLWRRFAPTDALLRPAAFFWHNAATNPWAPRVVLVAACLATASDQQIRRLYDGLTRDGPVYRPCTAGEEETKGGDDDRQVRRFSSVDAPPTGTIDADTILVLRPVLTDGENTSVWIFVPWP
ncbi:hypothetical protein EBZ80_24675, partial [bacterium]|nr:hypothetical protein [bacterium]